MKVLSFAFLVALIACGCRHGMASLPGSPYAREPWKAKLLYEANELALFAGETESDIAFNKSNECLRRNSLFMRRRIGTGHDEWRLIMTSDGDACDERRDFEVMKASLSDDRQLVWMVCDPHIGTYYVVGCLDLRKNTFRVLTDGDNVEAQSDGTILVKGKKTYLSDENGEPLGAAWYDLWMDSDGNVIRKTEPVTLQQLQDEWVKECQDDK